MKKNNLQNISQNKTFQNSKITVCLCTYNGGNYISDQLFSLTNQTVLPTEIIIFDDASNDNTQKIIESFIAKNKKISWKYHKNTNNIGRKSNFYNAISKSAGDIIFLCDQDDIWDSRKIEIMSNVLTENKKIELLVCNYIEFKDINEPSVKNKISFHKTKIKFLRSKSYFIATKFPGCTYAFKKNLIQFYLSSRNMNFAHDSLLWKISFLRHSLASISYQGIFWRRHSAAATINKTAKFSNERINNRKFNIYLNIQYIQSLLLLFKENKDICLLLKKFLLVQELRSLLYEKKKLSIWLNLFFYLPYYSSLKKYFIDFLVLIKRN